MSGRIKIGEMMLRAGLVDQLQLNAALAHQRQWGGKLGNVLVELGFVDEDMLWKGLSRQLGLQRADLTSTPISPQLLQRIPVDLLEKYQVFPVAYRDDTKTLVIASSDAGNTQATDELSFRTGWRVACMLAPESEIQWAIRRYYRGDNSPPPALRKKKAAVQQTTAEDEEEFKVTDISGKTVMKRISDIKPPAPAAAPPLPPIAAPPPMAAVPPAPAPSFGSPISTSFGTPSSAPDLAGADLSPQLAAVKAELDKGNKFLKSVVELCIARGIFTQQEYIERLRRP